MSARLIQIVGLFVVGSLMAGPVPAQQLLLPGSELPFLNDAQPNQAVQGTEGTPGTGGTGSGGSLLLATPPVRTAASDRVSCCVLSNRAVEGVKVAVGQAEGVFELSGSPLNLSPNIPACLSLPGAPIDAFSCTFIVPSDTAGYRASLVIQGPNEEVVEVVKAE